MPFIVLIVEPDPGVQQALVNTCQQHNLSTISCTDKDEVEEWLDRISTSGGSAVIVTGPGLCVEDTRLLAILLRRQEVEAPIVVDSQYAWGHEEKLKEAGVTHVISSRDDLGDRLIELLANSS